MLYKNYNINFKFLFLGLILKGRNTAFKNSCHWSNCILNYIPTSKIHWVTYWQKTGILGIKDLLSWQEAVSRAPNKHSQNWSFKELFQLKVVQLVLLCNRFKWPCTASQPEDMKYLHSACPIFPSVVFQQSFLLQQPLTIRRPLCGTSSWEAIAFLPFSVSPCWQFFLASIKACSVRTKVLCQGNSRVVQWLGLSDFHCPGLIPGWGTQIP